MVHLHSLLQSITPLEPQVGNPVTSQQPGQPESNTVSRPPPSGPSGQAVVPTKSPLLSENDAAPSDNDEDEVASPVETRDEASGTNNSMNTEKSKKIPGLQLSKAEKKKLKKKRNASAVNENVTDNGDMFGDNVDIQKSKGAIRKNAFDILMPKPAESKSNSEGHENVSSEIREKTPDIENVVSENTLDTEKNKFDEHFANQSLSYWEDDTGVRQPLTVRDVLPYKTDFALSMVRRSSLSNPGTSTPRAFHHSPVSCAMEGRRLSVGSLSSFKMTTGQQKRERSSPDQHKVTKNPRTDHGDDDENGSNDELGSLDPAYIPDQL